LKFNLPEIIPEQKFVLSRFAYSRCLEYKTIIETPLQPVQIKLTGWLGTALWGLLSCPSTCSELCSAIPASDPAIVKLILQWFGAAGVIQPAEGADGIVLEERDIVLRQWDFHDLLFHSRVRNGRRGYKESQPVWY
jgi:hypothetical protein